jgi:hypothetical protein
MDTKDFLLHLKSLRAQFEVQLLTGIEYNRKLLNLHADHAAALLVEQPGPKVVHEPVTVPAIPRGLTSEHVKWAQQHDWYLTCGLDIDGYYVMVRNNVNPMDSELHASELEFRDYNELRAWAGY